MKDDDESVKIKNGGLKAERTGCREGKKRRGRGEGRGQWNGQVLKVNYRFRQGVLMFKEIQTEGERRDERVKWLKRRTASHLLTEAALLNTLLSVISPCLFIITTPISKD